MTFLFNAATIAGIVVGTILLIVLTVLTIYTVAMLALRYAAWIAEKTKVEGEMD